MQSMIAAKLRSLLVSCPRCLEGYHPQETICFSPQVADGTTLAILVRLLEGCIVEPADFAFINVCAIVQYLLIMEDYLTPHLLPYMSDKDTCNNPTTLKDIELLYVAGYQSLAKHLYILACSHITAQTMQTSYELFPDLFHKTDFFWD